MNDPKIVLNKKKGDYGFTLSNVDVSIANGLRRIILTHIPVVGFDPQQCTIETNTTQFINEILKHRLTCIPVMIEHYSEEDPASILPKQYKMVLDIENTDKEEMLITTGDFTLVNRETGNNVSKTELEKIFPRNPLTGDYILFTRLRPQLSPTILGQSIKLECGFNVFTAKQDPVYNAVSKCTFWNTPNQADAKEAWERHKLELLKKYGDDLTDDELRMEKKNFEVLDAYRYFKKDSFEFIIKSESIYSESQIVVKGCSIIIDKLERFIQEINKTPADNTEEENNETTPLVEIKLSKDVLQYPSTMENSYDVLLHGEDYTLGNILFHQFYETYQNGEKIANYCAFKVFHPHDTYGVLRIAFKAKINNDDLLECLKVSANKAIEIYRKIQKHFRASK